MDLPKELRDNIYDYSIEPKADFLHTTLKEPNPDYHLPTIAPYDAGSTGETGHEIDSIDNDDVEDQELRPVDHSDLRYIIKISDNGRKINDYTRILAFKLRMVPTPRMLLVSKSINHEFRQRANALHLYYRDLIKSWIHLDRIISPCPLFLDICARSSFVFTGGRDVTLYYVTTLPSAMRDRVRSILIKPTGSIWSFHARNRSSVLCSQRMLGELQTELRILFTKQLPSLCYFALDMSAAVELSPLRRAFSDAE